MVVLESPHRLAATLADLAAVLGGDRRVVVARELTKLHEEFRRGTLDEVAAWAAEPPKGEIVLEVARRLGVSRRRAYRLALE